MVRMESALRVRGATAIEYPSGRWGFAGAVPGRLAFVRQDGTEPTAEEIDGARQFGASIVGLRLRTWATEAEAKEAEILERAPIEADYYRASGDNQ